MSLRFGLQNFQSIEKARFVFEPGLTVFIGPNSSGKTALLRAVKALVENKPSSHEFVKHGTESCTVALAVDGQPPVYWQRWPNTSVYKIGDQVYEKAGKTKLHTLLPQFPFVYDTTGRLVNIHSEWDRMFPFGYSGTELFRLFEDIFQIADSAAIVKGMREDELECRAKIKKATEDQQTLSTKLLNIEDVRLRYPVEKLVAYQTRLQDLEKKLQDIRQDVALAKKARSVIESSLPHEAPLAALDSLISRATLIQDFKEAHRLHRSCGVKLSECVVSSSEVLSKGSLCTQLVRDLREAKHLELVNSVSLESRTYDQAVPIWSKSVTLAKEVSEARSLCTVLQRKIQSRQIDCTAFQTWESASQSLAQSHSLHEALTSVGTDLRSLEDTRQNLKTALDQFTVCPLCQQSLPHSH